MADTSSAKSAPVPSPTVPPNIMGDLTRVSTPTLRRGSVSNLRKMGRDGSSLKSAAHSVARFRVDFSAAAGLTQ